MFSIGVIIPYNWSKNFLSILLNAPEFWYFQAWQEGIGFIFGPVWMLGAIVSSPFL